MSNPRSRAGAVALSRVDASAESPAAERCPRCGASFGCGMATGDCWCAQLPPLARSPGAAAELARLPASCLCPACVRALLSGTKA